MNYIIILCLYRKKTAAYKHNDSRAITRCPPKNSYYSCFTCALCAQPKHCEPTPLKSHNTLAFKRYSNLYLLACRNRKYIYLFIRCCTFILVFFFSFDVSDDFAFFGAAIVDWTEWIVDAVAKSHYRIKYGEMYVMMIKNGRTSGLNRML